MKNVPWEQKNEVTDGGDDVCSRAPCSSNSPEKSDGDESEVEGRSGEDRSHRGE